VLDSDPLRDAFSEYASQTRVLVRPAGVDAAEKTVRGRLRNRTIAISGALAILFVLPAVAYAIVSRPTGPPVAPPATAAPEPDQVKVLPTDPVPAGGLSAMELQQRPIEVPAWPSPGQDCPSGQVTVGSVVTVLPALNIASTIYPDLDSDGVAETVVVFVCTKTLVRPPAQVLAYKRDTDGGARLLGPVVAVGEQVHWIGQPDAMSDGTVRVRVGDRPGPVGVGQTSMQTQLRAYRWDGHRFSQSSGSRSFHPESLSTDLVLTNTPLAFGEPVNGVRTATVTFTIRNNGPAPVDSATLEILSTGFSIDLGGWEALRQREAAGAGPILKIRRGLGFLAVNETVTFDVTFNTTHIDTRREGSLTVLALPMTADGDQVRDLNPANNENWRLLAEQTG
jgi:hypothetical protein